MKQRHFIDLHKGCTFLYILFLIGIYSAFDNSTIWLYLGLHGTYGFLWIIKSIVFPDKSWEKQSGILYGLLILFGLSLYWIAPWLIVSGYFNDGNMVVVPNWLISLSVFLFGMGIFLHFTSDMQKYITLKLNPGKLITSGLFLKSRNMNYFGEFLIYTSFSILSMHWIPFICLLIFIVFIWIPNMKKKDKSLSRFSSFSEYKKKSNLFLPF